MTQTCSGSNTEEKKKNSWQEIHTMLGLSEYVPTLNGVPSWRNLKDREVMGHGLWPWNSSIFNLLRHSSTIDRRPSGKDPWRYCYDRWWRDRLEGPDDCAWWRQSSDAEHKIASRCCGALCSWICVLFWSLRWACMHLGRLRVFTGVAWLFPCFMMFYECFWHSINISFHMAPICSRSQWQLPALPKEHAWSRWRGCSLSWHDLCLDWLVAYAARRHQTPINQGRHGSNRILLDSILLDLTFSYITVWYVLLWPACDCECPVTGFC